MTVLTRRSLLRRGATMVAAGMAVPSFIAETARLVDPEATFADSAGARPARAAGRRVLVLVQLAGGNDGLNTLIPYADQAYYGARPTLAIPRASVLPLDDAVGLHPSLTRLKARYDRGQMALVQGVSYPNPDRSHFRGTDIWESAAPDRLEPKGWMGRYLEACGCGREDHLEAMAVGMRKTPATFWTEMSLVPAVASLGSFRYIGVNGSDAAQRDFELRTLRTGLAQASGRPEGEFLRQSILTALADADALQSAATSYTPVGVYPTNEFGNSMRLVTQLIAADVGTSVFYVSLNGFDTHSGQPNMHAGLLGTFDRAMDAFLQDLETIGKLGDVTVMTFSEFGRRLAENGSVGTDHGVAAPMFMLGGALNQGLHGAYPSLTDLTGGDLKMKVDFRSVYATVLQHWLGVSPVDILGGSFPMLPLFRSQVGPPGPTPGCAPRPAPKVSAMASGPGRLQVTVAAGLGTLKAIQVGTATNALIDASGETGRTGPFAMTVPPSAKEMTFVVRRAATGAPTSVPLVVVDDCGEWPTFVGMGAETP